MIFDFFEALKSKNSDGTYAMSAEEFVDKVGEDINGFYMKTIRERSGPPGSIHFRRYDLYHTPLYACIWAQRYDVLERLSYISEIKIDQLHPENGETALWKAIYKSDVKAITILLQMGASVHAKNTSGMTVLKFAELGIKIAKDPVIHAKIYELLMNPSYLTEPREFIALSKSAKITIEEKDTDSSNISATISQDKDEPVACSADYASATHFPLSMLGKGFMMIEEDYYAHSGSDSDY